MKCKNCGREIGDKKFCGYCGTEHMKKHKRKPVVVWLLLVVFVVGGVIGVYYWGVNGEGENDFFTAKVKPLFCEHEWTEATCKAPETCSLCGKEKGDVLAHSWKPANCSSPVTCRLCGEEYGLPVDHKWTEASCSVPKTCVWCSKTEGEALGHKWKKATHDTPKRCTTCGYRPGLKTLIWDIEEGYGDEVFVDNWNIHPSVLKRTINCAELTLNINAETNDDKPMEGLFRLYVKKPSGEWVYVTDVDVDKDVSEYEILFGYDTPMEFSAYHLLPPKTYSGSYSVGEMIMEAIVIE